jgi:DNA-binding MarR family transcriptional regulator
MIGLTLRQRDALLALQEIVDTGQRPTFALLRDELGLAHRSGAVFMIKGLIDRGYVKRDATGAIVILQRLPVPEDFAVEITYAGRKFIEQAERAARATL